MKKMNYIVAALALVAATSCMSEKIDNTVSGNYVEFTASNVETKTSLENGTEIYWNPGDKISVYDAATNKGVEFGTDIKEKSASAKFTGFASPVESTYYAMYPADPKTVTWTAPGKVTINLTNQQQSRKGSVPSNCPIVAYAKCSADNLNLQFHHCFAYIHFKIANTAGLKNVVFISKDKTKAFGSLTLDLNTGKVEIPAEKFKFSIILKGNPTVYPGLNPGDYYIAILPGVHKEGFDIRCVHADNKADIKLLSGERVLEAGKVYNIGTIY